MATKKTAELYNGKVVIDFTPETHRYQLKGQKTYLVSVTSATGMLDKSRVLIIWATNLAKDFLLKQIETLKTSQDEDLIKSLIDSACSQHQIKKEQAADIGTQVHEWAEKHIARENPELPTEPKVLNGVMAFMKWLDENKFKFTASEKLVYSKKYEYVGLMDAAATLGKKKYVIDFKTSKGIYNEYRYQVSAYLKADEEESGVKYDGYWLVRFDKETGEFEPHLFDDSEEIEKDFEAFKGLLAVKKREKQLTKWE